MQDTVSNALLYFYIYIDQLLLLCCTAAIEVMSFYCDGESTQLCSMVMFIECLRLILPYSKLLMLHNHAAWVQNRVRYSQRVKGLVIGI